MIQANRLDAGFLKYQKEFEDKAVQVLRSGWYILGKEVEAFEKEFAAYVGSPYCVGVGNGLDALKLAFRALGIGEGDEVITQANTYIASVMGISMNNATPVLVEPDEFYGPDPDAIEKAITPRTKAVLVVHLYGQACDMERIADICRRHNLRLVEDCAQSHGSCFDGRMTGTFGDVGCFSFYPTKNLGAFGDAGAVTCSDEKLAETFRMLRNYGSKKRYYFEVVGENTRLDEMQAGLLRVRLSHMEELTKERRKIAAFYDEKLVNPLVKKPAYRKGATHVFHQYVVRCERRDELAEFLRQREVGTIIHYPIPPHLSEAYKYLGYKRGDLPVTEEMADQVLSLPMFNGMSAQEMETVAEAVNAFGV